LIAWLEQHGQLSERGAARRKAIEHQAYDFVRQATRNPRFENESLALVIVDTAYPKPVKLGQLIDFAALVGLADISVDANVGDTPSILRIFDQTTDEQAPGLTQWDSAFLNSLYQSDQAAVVQRSQMAVEVSH